MKIKYFIIKQYAIQNQIKIIKNNHTEEINNSKIKTHKNNSTNHLNDRSPKDNLKRKNNKKIEPIKINNNSEQNKIEVLSKLIIIQENIINVFKLDNNKYDDLAFKDNSKTKNLNSILNSKLQQKENYSNPKPKNIKSDYILKKIFFHLKKNKTLSLIKYNKNFQQKLNLNRNDYKEFCDIEIKLS